MYDMSTNLIFMADALDAQVDEFLSRRWLVLRHGGAERPGLVWAPIEKLAVVGGQSSREQGIQQLCLKTQLLHFRVDLTAKVELRKEGCLWVTKRK
jgi:hypothetical protein